MMNGDYLIPPHVMEYLLLPAQAVFLRAFPAVYSELLKIFTVREVAGFIRETLSSLPTTVHAECPLEAVKLQCIAKTVESPLYINPGKDLFTQTDATNKHRGNQTENDQHVCLLALVILLYCTPVLDTPWLVVTPH